LGGAAGGERHDLGFLPWVAKVGGTTLEDDSAHQRVPLLYSVYQAGQWDTQNIVETLMTSEVIAYASAPRLKVEGPTDSVEVDYGEPGRPAYVPPGHDLHQMAPPLLDQSLALVADRIGSRIGKSTVARILQTGDFPSGTAFATLNLATQSGIKALMPYKELAEQALADVFTQMLYWIDYEGKPVVAFGRGRDDPGAHHTIHPKDFDVENVFVDVELTADVPTDRMARINAASLAVRELGYSRERALEQIGETDPQVIMAQAREEEREEVEFEIEKAQTLARAQVETKQMVERLTRNLEASQDQTEQEYLKEEMKKRLASGKAPGVLAARKRESAPRKAGGRPLVGGQEFNPALGGSSPVEADPEMSNRKRSERTVSGEEIAEV